MRATFLIFALLFGYLPGQAEPKKKPARPKRTQVCKTDSFRKQQVAREEKKREAEADAYFKLARNFLASQIAINDVHPAILEDATLYVIRIIVKHELEVAKSRRLGLLPLPSAVDLTENQIVILNQILDGKIRKSLISRDYMQILNERKKIESNQNLPEPEKRKQVTSAISRELDLIFREAAYLDWSTIFLRLASIYDLEHPNAHLNLKQLFIAVSQDSWALNKVRKAILNGFIQNKSPRARYIMLSIILQDKAYFLEYLPVLTNYLAEPSTDSSPLEMNNALFAVSLVYLANQNSVLQPLIKRLNDLKEGSGLTMLFFLIPILAEHKAEAILKQLAEMDDEGVFYEVLRRYPAIGLSYLEKISASLSKSSLFFPYFYVFVDSFLQNFPEANLLLPANFWSQPLSQHSLPIQRAIIAQSTVSQLIEILLQEEGLKDAVIKEFEVALERSIDSSSSAIDLTEEQINHLIEVSSSSKPIAVLYRLALLLGGSSSDRVLSHFFAHAGPQELQGQLVQDALGKISPERVLRLVSIHLDSKFLNKILFQFAASLNEKDAAQLLKILGHLPKARTEALFRIPSVAELFKNKSIQESFLKSLDPSHLSASEEEVLLKFTEPGQIVIQGLSALGSNLRRDRKARQRRENPLQGGRTSSASTKDLNQNPRKQLGIKDILVDGSLASPNKIISLISRELADSPKLGIFSDALALIEKVDWEKDNQLSEEAKTGLANILLSIIGTNVKENLRTQALYQLIRLSHLWPEIDSIFGEALASYYSSNVSVEQLEQLVRLCLHSRDPVAILSFDILRKYLSYKQYKGLPSLNFRLRIFHAFSLFSQSKDPLVRSLLAALCLPYAGRQTGDLEEATTTVTGLARPIAQFVGSQHSHAVPDLTTQSCNKLWMPIYSDRQNRWTASQIKDFEDLDAFERKHGEGRFSEMVGMHSALNYEIFRGRVPIDVSANDKNGYDIISYDFRRNTFRLIEAKGKRSDGLFLQVDFTDHENVVARRNPDNYYLYHVRIDIRSYTTRLTVYHGFAGSDDLKKSLVKRSDDKPSARYNFSLLDKYRVSDGKPGL